MPLGPTHVARFPSLDGDPRVGKDPTMSIQAVTNGEQGIDCIALADKWRVTPDEAQGLADAILAALADLSRL